MNLKITNNNGLAFQVIENSLWTFFLRLVQLLLNITKIVILARLLSPEIFGSMGIILIILNVLKTCTQTGFDEALIQKTGKIEEYLNTYFLIMLGRGIILFLVLLSGASLVSKFFNLENLLLPIYFAGSVLLLESLENPALILMKKELNFKKLNFFQTIVIIFEMFVTVILAFNFQSVWALIGGLIAGVFIKVVLSYFIYPFIPGIAFNWNKAWKMFSFGKWISMSKTLIFMLSQGDDMVVGKMLGSGSLGFYQMAYKISNTPATEFSNIIAQIIYPAYSKLQNDLQKFKTAFINVFQIVLLVAIPFSGIIFSLANELTIVLLGSKWISIVQVVKILSVYGLIRAVGATTGIVFMALNRSKLRFKIQSAQLFFLMLIIIPCVNFWGINGAAFAVVLDSLIFVGVSLWFVLSILKVRRKEIIKKIFFTGCGLLISIVVVKYAQLIFQREINFVSLLIFSSIWVLTYAGFIIISDKLFNFLNKEELKKQISLLIKKTSSKESRECVLCGATKFKIIKMNNGLNLRVCNKCKLISSETRLGPEEIKESYRDKYYHDILNMPHDQSIKMIQNELEKNVTRVNNIVKIVENPATLLDVGCGQGFFLKSMQNIGWKVTGTDISQWACEFALKNLQVNVICTDFLNLKLDNKFAVITMNHVLEHTPEPIKALKLAYELLENNGVLIINGPDYASFDRIWHGEYWRGYSEGYHLFHFKSRTYIMMLKKTGFAIIAKQSSFWDPLAHLCFINSGFSWRYDRSPSEMRTSYNKKVSGGFFKNLGRLLFKLSKMFGLKDRDIFIVAKKKAEGF